MLIKQTINNINLHYQYIFCIGLLILLSIPFSPLFTYFAIIYYFIFLGICIPRPLRICFFTIALFSFLNIYYSRSYIEELSLDLGNYYQAYILLLTNPSEAIFSFGSSIEIGWPVLMYIQSYLFGPLSPLGLAYFNTVFCLSIFILWVETKGIKQIKSEYIALMYAFILAFISMKTFGYLQRQAISTVILLFALTSKKNINFFLIVCLATIFHSTALIIGTIYFCLKKINITTYQWIFALLCLITIRVFFNNIVTFFLLFAEQFPILYKFGYYSDNNNFTLAGLRYSTLILPLLFLATISNTLNNFFPKNVVLFSCISFIALIGIPLLSERINYLLLYIYGYLIFLCIYNNKLNLLLGVWALLCYTTFSMLELSNLVAIKEDPFWQRFPMWSLEPFYYLFN